ncbi:GNAT family N-acetyltransferase [Aeromicrobium duanguangcaii]|uniref:GNAT family N-acetyltransferase n=1 Tax=Aeromicrobium duanguangcaii TaxID=2968086 RepID=A0ABY5KKF7_9ACTN|nr:GNAT family N-acetyltransferase [Aeromicrobium duanguangcaii]MCD9152953.1 GNAT family N-acetyltransferase [Aeromicrobium duanguangcaii]UUI69941.1 GNAT family N-acetyltransferase [Aeromicrobium duanguangcaii]
MSSIRLVTMDDAAELAALFATNRGFLAPWEPDREDDFFSTDGQRAVLEEALERHGQGLTYPHVILDASARIIGRINLGNVVLGPFQSCGVGYWVSQHANGRGHASAALQAIKNVAFADLGLHRIEAGTLAHNVRSQRVLEKNGFVRFGVAPAYLKIAGSWQDHTMFQALNPHHH